MHGRSRETTLQQPILSEARDHAGVGGAGGVGGAPFAPALCALQHPARLAELVNHHAQLRLFRDLPSNFLPGTRDLLVYLPAGYEADPDRRYPVLYMHDGQNLFDPATAFVRGQHWRIAESADRLIAQEAAEPMIIVGIPNAGQRRLAEYTHSPDPAHGGGGEADCYGHMLTGELMPFIDETFRTLGGPEHTGIGGSSLGGLVSLYLGFRYPERFGRIAALSPSIWWDGRSILGVLRQLGAPEPRPRVWVCAGDQEGPRCQPDAELLARQLVDDGWVEGRDLLYRAVAGGRHAEEAWAARFPEVLRFLFPAQGS